MARDRTDRNQLLRAFERRRFLVANIQTVFSEIRNITKAECEANTTLHRVPTFADRHGVAEVAKTVGL
jgi:hypothetical protein